MAAAPKARGRAAALQQLQEKRAAAGPVVEVPSAVGAAADGAPAAPAAAPEIRTTFAERVGDVKSNVERMRQEYRTRTEGALGHLPSAGPSATMAGMHQRFADLEVSWGEVMDSAKIDPLSTSTPGVNAASAALAKNRSNLDSQVDAVLVDLWEGVSGGQSRVMSDQHKDRMMQSILRPQMGQRQPAGGMYLGPGNAPRGGPAYGMELALGAPDSPDPMDRAVQFAIPDGASRREIEEIRNEVLRLEQIVEQAVLEEERRDPLSDDDLPPPPPLIEKDPQMLAAENKAQEFSHIYKRIQISDVGCEPDSGGTPCNSVDDPTVPVMLPPRGGMDVFSKVRGLEKEVARLRAAAIQEVGSIQNARKLAGKHRGGKPVY